MSARRDRDWDVVIVGARVAGASTAMLLARAGLRVLVVDRARRGSDTLSTHALMRGGVLQLRRWGLLDRVVTTGAPAVRRVTFHYGAERWPVALKTYAGVDALYAPRRTVLDAVLVAAAEEAGAVVRFGLTATDLVRDAAGRVIGITVRDSRATARTEYTRLVVGADGRGSLVAARVAAPTITAGNHQTTFVYSYWPADGLDGYHWHYGDGLSAGVIPTNGGLACVFVGGPPALFAGAVGSRWPLVVLRRLAARLAGGLRDLVARPPAEAVRVFSGQPARLRSAFGPGWALVGDAGSWTDPLSTHGITDALRDADRLANAVVGGAASERATQTAMADYQQQRDRLAESMQPLADRLASHQWDPPEARLLLRALSALMTGEVETIRGYDPAPALIA